MQAQLDAVHGCRFSHWASASGGWPTELYDSEDWREEPPIVIAK
jgi:hypothetical protein